VSAAHAETQLAKLVAAQLEAGFTLASDVVAVRVAEREALPPELVARIVENPDDDEAFTVLGDALIERGDPHGELGARMRAAAMKPSRKARAAVAELMAEHADELLGELADLFELGAYDEPPLVWKHGFIASARLEYPSPRELAALLSHRSAHFLVELELEGATPELVATIAAHAPRALRVLDLHARRDIGALGALWPALPQLRRLRIHARELSVGELVSPRLERLELAVRIMPGHIPRAVAAAPLPLLERLTLRFGFRNDGGGHRDPELATFDDVRPLLARTDLPKLTHLRLVRGFASDVARELGTRPLAEQLVSLELSGSYLDERSVRELAGHRMKFAKLRELLAIECGLTPGAETLLRSITPSLVMRAKGVLLGDQLDTLHPIDGPGAVEEADEEMNDDERFDEIEE